MTDDEIKNAISGLKTKADMIRKLDSLGVERAKIATYLDIRYQHVWNVLQGPAPAKRRAGVDWASDTTAGDDRDDNVSVAPLTIDEAKRGLAAQFGVDPSAIEIVIRA